MREYITDSIYFKKNNKDFLFFSNEIYTWRIVDSSEGYLYQKNGNQKIDNEITGLVSSSNYRLLFDILNIDEEAKLYLPEYNKKTFKKKYKVNKDEIFLEFDKYMKRSFISYLSYSSLKNIGLKRIEPFLILLLVIVFSKKKIYDNLIISEKFNITDLKVEKKQIYKKDIELNLMNFIYTASIELNYEFKDVFSYILKLYSELKCSDPFSKNGIIFFNDDNELYNIYAEISDTEVYINRSLISDGKNKIIINNGIDSYSEIIVNYYFLQEEDYFKNKTLLSKEKSPSIIEIVKYLEKIIPLKDILLSIQLLEKMKTISINDFNISMKSGIESRLKFKDNSDWISLNLWKDIYENIDYVFNDLLEPIEVEALHFECPICNNNVYSITPQKLFCSSKDCDFSFYRTNLKDFGIKRISLENIIEGLKNKTLLIERDDGKNIPVFLKNNESFYSFWIK